MLKIMHTGDIHLDSPFSGLTPRFAETRRGELRATFTSMMTYAKMNNVDLMLIAGDVFDSEYVTRETYSLLCREFENFGKPVFITPGNHDPASRESVWQRYSFPDNVCVFRDDKLASVELDGLGGCGVTVYGFGYTSAEMTECPLVGFSVRDRDRINLLVCHSEIGVPSTKNCPLSPAQIEVFGADYTALGHIHNPPTPGKNNRYSYCGCPEPRAFDETGAKGALIVEIDKDGRESHVNIKPVRFSKRRYERGEITVDGAASMTDIDSAVKKFVYENRYGEDTLLSLKIRGYVSPSLIIDTESMDGAAYGLYFMKVEDATLPDLDTDALLSDVTIRGEVFRQLKPMLDSSDEREKEVGRRALRYAFSALSGESI